MRIFVLLLAVFSSSLALAEGRNATVRQLMEAQGLIPAFEQQLALGREQTRKQGRAILDQLLASMNPSAEFKERFEGAFQEFMAEVETPWSAEEIVAVWARYYGEQFTDDELHRLLDFYQSPLGQKEVVASREAMVKFSTHFAEAGKPIAEKAVSHFIANMRVIARECKCRR